MSDIDEMSDSEMWRERKKDSQEKRATNRENSVQLLTEWGIAYEVKNGGAHLIVKHRGLVVDFWPGTGKWIVRGGGSGRGIYNLKKEFLAS